MISWRVQLQNQKYWENVPMALANDFDFLASKGANDFIRYAKKKIAREMEFRFTIRKSNYKNLTRYIRATKNKLRASIYHLSPSIVKHEEAPTLKGVRFIPDKVRRSKYASIPKSKKPNVLLSKDKQFFAIWGKGEEGGGIYRRKRGSSKIERMYAITKVASYPYRFSFDDVLSKDANRNLPRYFAININREMKKRGFKIAGA